MRSEHNGGASLAAFLLAVSTVTLLFVSPVEGQGEACVVTAFPGEPEACPATDSQGNLLFCDTGTCEECCPSSGRFPNCQLSDCDRLFAGDAAQVASCQRSCFGFYACDTDTDCPGTAPFCINGQCEECVVTAFPGEIGSCPATDSQGDALLCVSGQCQTCESLIIVGIPDCEILFTGEADQIANCQRSCFDFYTCDTNTDCPGTAPFCNAGECEQCVNTAFPGETGSCPATDSQGNPLLCVSDQCQTCESVLNQGDCGTAFTGDADQIANCQRDCFDFYTCDTNTDCRPANRPTCISGVCELECEVSAFPGAAGSCQDNPVGVFAGPQFCIRYYTDASVCLECARYEQELGITTAADCALLESEASQTADVVANCQRGCFGFYACTSDSDCPGTLPFCNAGECALECVVNADCPGTAPFCINGECEECVVTAFPGEIGSCPATDSQGDALLCVSGQCQTCESLIIVGIPDCEILFTGEADQIANCQRSCFDFYTCDTNTDCPGTAPFCNAGECEQCVNTAFPGETGSCPATDSQGNPLLCVSDQCQTCESVLNQGDCGTAFTGDADQIANCQRDCFDFYTCDTNTDCRPANRPTCISGVCELECEVSAFPGAAGSCQDNPVGVFAGPQFCIRYYTDASVCLECARYEQELGITTAADCALLESEASQTADVVANCQRGCFGFYACTSDSDCPGTLPFCNAGECALECVVNADCPGTAPFCINGECEECVVTAFPGEPGSCPALDVQGNPLLCVSGLCFTCESADIAVLGDCADQFYGDADQIANCQRDCFAHYECTSNADCPANEPTCIIIGQCRRECEVNALPGAAGSCPDIPAGQLFAGPEFCVQGGVTSVCIECARYEQELGITTAADCLILGGLGHTADDIANCQRGCFGFYACATSADCPADRPLCESGQCLCGTNADCPADRPLCESGQCLTECGTNADCPADRPLCESEQCLAECANNADCPADRPLCDAGQCLAECGTNADCPADTPLCDAGQCLAECGTNADCPADRPLCESGQCVVSSVPSSPTFSPLDGMGGGSSA